MKLSPEAIQNFADQFGIPPNLDSVWALVAQFDPALYLRRGKDEAKQSAERYQAEMTAKIAGITYDQQHPNPDHQAKDAELLASLPPRGPRISVDPELGLDLPGFLTGQRKPQIPSRREVHQRAAAAPVPDFINRMLKKDEANSPATPDQPVLPIESNPSTLDLPAEGSISGTINWKAKE